MRAATSATAAPAVQSPSTEAPIDVATAKARARRAWLDAKRHKVAPVPLLDRWHSDTLLAIQDAPEPVAIIMLGRSETLYKLLIDRLRWLDRPE